MKRTVYECHLCGDGKKPCRLVSIGEGKECPHLCPYDADFDPSGWQKVSECEIPDDEDENMEYKPGPNGEIVKTEEKG